jgi:chromosomal replication initiation ATPase DnaA
VRTVVKMTAEHFELSVREITGVYRHPRFARPRMVIYYVARHFMASFPLIGRLTKRDHTTVISGRKTIKERMAAGDDELKTAVNAIGARAAAAFGMEWLPVGDPPQQFEPESME